MAWIRSLAKELPYATGVANKKKRKKEKKEKVKRKKRKDISEKSQEYGQGVRRGRGHSRVQGNKSNVLVSTTGMS